jgi:NTE family protein
MVAAMYAFNVSIDTITNIARDLTLSQITTFKLNKTGFFNADPLKEILVEYLGEANIEDASIPLAIVATDLKKGEEVIFTHGPLADAVCASASIPGVYIPMKMGERTLVDGGIVQTVPVRAVKDMGAGVIIASQLNGVGAYEEPKNVLDVMRNAFDIALSRRTREEVKEADLVIAMDLKDFSIADNTERYDELFTIGYDTATKGLTKMAWYRKSNLLLYVWRIVCLLTPFKVPEFIRQINSKSREK